MESSGDRQGRFAACLRHVESDVLVQAHYPKELVALADRQLGGIGHAVLDRGVAPQRAHQRRAGSDLQPVRLPLPGAPGAGSRVAQHRILTKMGDRAVVMQRT